MKKKVLFVVDERVMGGVSVVLNDMLHLMDTSVYQLDVLVLHNRGNMLETLPNEVNVYYGTPYFEAIDYTMKEVLQKHSLSLLFKKVRVVIDLKTGWIKRRIQKERTRCIRGEYDVEVAFKDGFCALFTAFGKTKKKVHWLHCAYQTNNPNAKYETLFKKALPMFDHIVGVATNVVKEFNEIYGLQEKSQVIPVAMDVERIINLSKQEAKIQLNKDVLQLVVVGRAHPVKGYERLIDVLSLLHQENKLKDVEVHLFGDGPLFESLQQQIQRLHLTSIVYMEGNINNPYAEVKQYDTLLLPSYSEAFGTVITEAFLVGIPVLATRTSASEMSVKEEYGWICENDEEGVYRGLVKLIESRDEIKIRKENLRNFVYHNDTILKDIDEVLR